MASRSSSVRPPQTPYGSRTASACSRHCVITGQEPQMAFAAESRLRRAGPRSPSGWKNRVGSASRHAPRNCHSHRSATGPGSLEISAIEATFVRLVALLALPVPPTLPTVSHLVQVKRVTGCSSGSKACPVRPPPRGCGSTDPPRRSPGAASRAVYPAPSPPTPVRGPGLTRSCNASARGFRWRGSGGPRTIEAMATTDRGDDASPTPPPMLTVAAVARRLGVAPSTLRTCARRYDLGPSAHTAGSHRRYGPDAPARLVVMRRLTLEGVPPADAARIALAASPGPASTGLSGSEPDADERNASSGATAASSEGDSAEAGHPATGRNGDAAEAGQGNDLDPAAAQHLLGEAVRPIAIPAARRSHAFEFGAPLLDPDPAPSAGVVSGWPVGTAARAGAALRPGGRAGGGRVVALPDGSPAAR